jgi:hypothetical protein
MTFLQLLSKSTIPQFTDSIMAGDKILLMKKGMFEAKP